MQAADIEQNVRDLKLMVRESDLALVYTTFRDSSDYALHLQHDHQEGVYENVDIGGLRIRDRVSRQEAEVVALELKATNRKEDVLSTISQAVNYGRFANEVYIAVPRFTFEAYHATEEYDALLHQCQSNQLGVISIDVHPEGMEVGVLEVVRWAPYRTVDDTLLLRKLLDTAHIDFCPLCRRFVRVEGADRLGCGWEVADANGELTVCMKSKLETFATK